MKPGVQTVDRRVGSEIIKIKCPSDILEYQKHMGGVDRGDQHRVMGAGFVEFVSGQDEPTSFEIRRENADPNG